MHIGGSSRAAARRTGQRGDGYFAGGILPEPERDIQWELAKASAVEAGRDPDKGIAESAQLTSAGTRQHLGSDFWREFTFGRAEDAW
ncbi:hypothetical protein ACFQZZ_05815 [Nocardia sp. GCM10030253]|uniref:hypothetical protein n=1 Tax=Nocardia sp. GCM10030253 TaxID=3273404 RepID=UPI00362EAF44